MHSFKVHRNTSCNVILIKERITGDPADWFVSVVVKVIVLHTFSSRTTVDVKTRIDDVTRFTVVARSAYASMFGTEA